MKKEENLSNCCEAKMRTDCADEGTCCFICEKCNKPCDILPQHPNKEMEMKDTNKLEEILKEADYIIWSKSCETISGTEVLQEMIREKINQAYSLGIQLGKADERQFILNVLDGVDIADEQIGNKGGGTKAIRFALQSRIIENSLLSDYEDKR